VKLQGGVTESELLRCAFESPQVLTLLIGDFRGPIPLVIGTGESVS